MGCVCTCDVDSYRLDDENWISYIIDSNWMPKKKEKYIEIVGKFKIRSNELVKRTY